MKTFKVCSFENRQNTEIYQIVHENHQSYCNLNGYEYQEVTDFSKWPQFKFPHFYKFYAIKEALQNCDYLLYIDMDAIFTNMNKRIEEFIFDGHILLKGDIFISKDNKGGRCLYDNRLE